MRNVALTDLKGRYKKSIDSLREAGFEMLEDLFVVDMARLSKLASIPDATLKKILVSAELQSYGVPSDVSDVIADSGAIARAGELAALGIESIKTLLARGAKPGEALEMSVEEIEKMKARVPRLTLGQEAPKAFVLEDEVAPVQYETVSALISEEPVVSIREVESFVTDLEETFRLFQERAKGLASKPNEPIAFSTMQTLAASLQEDIKSASTRILSKTGFSPELTLFESEAESMMDERIELDAQMKDLSNKIAALQDQLSALKAQRAAVHEDLSPTTSEEKEAPPLRGEELGLAD